MSSANEKPLPIRLELCAAIVATAIWALGFGGLNMFWQFGVWPVDESGPLTLLSTTVGLGILLPIAAGILFSAKNQFSGAPGEKMIAAGAGLITFSAVLLDEIAFIKHSEPERASYIFYSVSTRVILPSIILPLVSAIVAGQLAIVVLRIRFHRELTGSPDGQLLARPMVVIVIGSLVAFVGLLTLDSLSMSGLSAPSTIRNVAILASSFVFALMFVRVVLAASGAGLFTIWPVTARGMVLAAAICVSAWNAHLLVEALSLPVIITLLFALAALGIYARATNGSMWFVNTLVASLILVFGSLLAVGVAKSDLLSALGVALGALVLMGLVIGMFAHREARDFALALVFPIGFLILASWARTYPGINLSVFSWALILVAAPLMTFMGVLLFQWLGQHEASLVESGPTLELWYWTTLGVLILLICGTQCAVLDFMNASRLISSGHAPSGPLTVKLTFIGLGFLIALDVALAALLISRRNIKVRQMPDWPMEPFLRTRTTTTLLLVFASILWACTPWVATLLSGASIQQSGPGHQVLVFGFLGALYAGWLCISTTDSLHSNVAHIEFYRFDRGAWAVSASCGIAAASTWAWLWFVGAWSGGDWTDLTTLSIVTGVIYFGSVLLVTICALTLVRSWPNELEGTGYLSLHHPAANVFNDQTLRGLCLVITEAAVFIIDAVLRENRTFLTGAPDWLTSAVILVPVIFIFVPAFTATLTNVATHLKHETNRISDTLMARAGQNLELAAKINEERVKRIRTRFKYLVGVAFFSSPIGVVARLTAWLKDAL